MEHLRPETVEVMSGPDARRFAFVEDIPWISYPRVEFILGQLNDSFRHVPHQRSPGLMIIGDIDSGKTALLERFTELHPEVENSDGTRQHPALLVRAPLRADEQLFYMNILNVLRVPFPPQENVRNRHGRVVAMMVKANVRMLLIDEIHNLLAGSHRAHYDFLNLLRDLASKLRIPIVGAGIETAYNALQYDKQLESRMPVVRLVPWQFNDDFFRLLSSYEGRLPLKHPSGLVNDPLARTLFDICQGSMGGLYTILKKATVEAIRSGQERVTVAIVKHVTASTA
ncbi:TniB family NTP-binding protein [Hymenobacter agri]